MVKAVIFDMFETLVSLYRNHPFMGREIAAELKLPEAVFRRIWDPSTDERTLGLLTFEDVIARIMKTHRIQNDILYKTILQKRTNSVMEAFSNPHPQILPMLQAIKSKGIKIGLLTNCFLEEKIIIETSSLYPFFDAVCMSSAMGMQKPDERFFLTCTGLLDVKPEECFYVGDGGSRELETAKKLGMHPLQATWYLDDPAYEQKTGIEQLFFPEDLLVLMGKSFLT